MLERFPDVFVFLRRFWYDIFFFIFFTEGLGTVPISAPSITRQQQGLDTMTLLLELEADVNAVDLEGQHSTHVAKIALKFVTIFIFITVLILLICCYYFCVFIAVSDISITRIFCCYFHYQHDQFVDMIPIICISFWCIIFYYFLPVFLFLVSNFQGTSRTNGIGPTS